MNNLADYEIDTILDGLERIARDANTADEKAMADIVYAKVVNTVIARERGV